MKRSLKERWVKALRSGTRKQGRNKLKIISFFDDEDRYCCLGVLADITHPSWWEGEKWHLSLEIQNKYSATMLHGSPNREGALGYAMLKEFGLHAGLERDLISLNDNGESFEEIASWIEEHVPVED